MGYVVVALVFGSKKVSRRHARRMLERWAGIRFLPVIIALFIGVKDRQLLGFLGMMGMALAFTDSAAVAGLNYPWELRSWMLQFGVTAHHYGVGMIVMNAWIPEY